MFSDDVRQKLQHIVRGAVIETAKNHCTTIRNFLCSSYSTSTAVKTNFEGQLVIKEEQAEQLRAYAIVNGLWLAALPQNSRYLTRGGESKVYLDGDNRHVIKVNDAVYYATWLEYFNSILLHNSIFPGTAYDFLGFIDLDGELHAVVRQLYITSDAPVDLSDISALLLNNGFVKTRRQDYFNAEFGLILEDMHDENVIMNSDTLFFIDTVFYIDVK